MQESPDEWYLINEAKTEIDGTKADGALGYFSKKEIEMASQHGKISTSLG